MSGKLYLVGTPIGNLGDLSPRAAETLSNVDFIAAEDTRVSIKLLNHLDIKKPLVSYHEHNRAVRGEMIVARILAGEDCALVTDAGMPAISDPGEDIVRLCHEKGVEVLAVPGPCALVTALAVSSMPTQRFCFEGFLSVTRKNRMKHLESLVNEERTMIFYEAPHKLTTTLEDLLSVLGNREISLCRELTKLHEEVIQTDLKGALEYFAATPPRGEFVLVVKGKEEESAPEYSREDALEVLNRFREEGKPLKEASKLASEETGYSKNELYNLAVEAEKAQ